MITPALAAQRRRPVVLEVRHQFGRTRRPLLLLRAVSRPRGTRRRRAGRGGGGGPSHHRSSARPRLHAGRSRRHGRPDGASSAPSALNRNLRWAEERGLNSLSMLTYLRVTHHVTKDARYDAAARELVTRHGYAMNLLYPKVTLGVGGGNQSDDEMAFMNYYHLLKYEQDPVVRGRGREVAARVLATGAARAQPVLQPGRSDRPEGPDVHDGVRGRGAHAARGGLARRHDRHPATLSDRSRRSRDRTTRTGSISGRSTRTSGPTPRRPSACGPATARCCPSTSGWSSTGTSIRTRSITRAPGARLADGTSFLLPYYMALYHQVIGSPAAAPVAASGYRGIWYMNEKVGGEYVYKYSGGFATYPQWHAPIAIHAPAVQTTFFVLGGSGGTVSESGDRLVHLVGAFDHRTGLVSRPVRLLDKQTEDAHDNPVLSIDGAGHLWVFSAAHGTSRPAYIHRSMRPTTSARGSWSRRRTSRTRNPGTCLGAASSCSCTRGTSRGSDRCTAVDRGTAGRGPRQRNWRTSTWATIRSRGRSATAWRPPSTCIPRRDAPARASTIGRTSTTSRRRMPGARGPRSRAGR